MASKLPSSVVSAIGFIGRGGGAVKALNGFKKGHHTLPDAANATTNAFLAKLCATELSGQAEALFQRVRAGLGYKRAEISLTVSSPAAVLTTKDFGVEIFYALEEQAPERYSVTQTLRDLRSAELAQTEEFAEIFAATFSEISFGLKKGARVEAVIDAIEATEADAGLTVNYPSDYRECVISVAGVDAQVRCTGATLDVVFPRAESPRELIAEFATVRDAFGVSRELAGLIG